MTEENELAPRRRDLQRCPICGHEVASRYFVASDRMHGVPGSYGYGRCASCHSVFQAPRVVDEDLHLLYPAGYHTHFPKEAPIWGDVRGDVRGGVGRNLREHVRELVLSSIAPHRGSGRPTRLGRVLSASRWMRERAFYDQTLDEMLPRRRPPGRALDVGCGAGSLLPRLGRLGYEVTGLEWDEAAAKVAHESTGLNVVVGSAERTEAASGRFDLIVLVHVLEHLPRPGRALRHLRSRLAEGGRLVVVYPNCESLLARRFGPDWFPWEVPRHLSLPTIRALRELSASSELFVAKVRTLSRWTTTHAWQSRMLAAGRRPDGLPQPSVGDRALGAVGRVATWFGSSIGEEVVAVLEPRP